MEIKVSFAETSYCVDGHSVLHITPSTGLAANATNQFVFKITLFSTTGIYSRVWENVLLPNGQETLSIPFVVPLEWANDFNGNDFDGTNGTLGVKMETKYTLFAASREFVGNYINYAISLRCTVDEAILPSVGMLGYENVDEIVPLDWHRQVQGLSQITIKAEHAIGAYNSKIIAYYFGANTAQQQNFANFLLKEAGDVYISVTVEDSRGRFATKDLYLYVEAYHPPSLTEIVSQRCDENGTLQEAGAHFLTSGILQGKTLEGDNPISLKVSWKKVTDQNYNEPIELSQNVQSVIDAKLESGASYDVKYTVSDFFHSIDIFDYLSSTSYLLHFLKGGTGIAVGKAAEAHNLFDVALDTSIRRSLTVGADLSVTGQFTIGGVEVMEILRTLQEPVEGAFLVNHEIFPHDWVIENKIVRCGKQVQYSLNAAFVMEPMPAVGQSIFMATIPQGFYSKSFLPKLSAMLNSIAPCAVEITQTGVVSIVISEAYQQHVLLTGTGVILDDE